MEEILISPSFQEGQSNVKQGFRYGDLSPASAKEIIIKTAANGYPFIESGFVTMVPNATVATGALRIEREWFEENPLQAANEQRKLDEADIFNPSRTRRRRQTAFIRVRRLSSHKLFNYAKLVGTYRGATILNKGMFEKGKSPGITNYFYNRVLTKPIQNQIGNLVVNGDYKSPMRSVSQMDGALKLLAYAGGDKTQHQIIYKIPELQTGEYLHILASNKKLTIAKQADLAAQLDAIETAVNAVTWKNRATNTDENLFTAEVVTIDAVKYLKVESTEHMRNVEFRIAIVKQAEIEWKNIRGRETYGGVEIKEETQGNLAQSPVLIDYLTDAELKAGTRTQQHDRVIDWYVAYSEAVDIYDDLEGIERSNVITYVSATMYRSLGRALLNSKNGFSGAAKEFLESLGLNLMIHPRLRGSETFTAERGNLHLAVDLVSDMGKISTDYDFDTESIKARVTMAMGMAWVAPEEIVTNAPHLKTKFEALDDYKDQFSDINNVDLGVFSDRFELDPK